MQETLFDRFRPFKPYDLILALLMLVLAAPSSNLPPIYRVLTLIGGCTVFCFLDWLQRYVRVPTPLWQSITIVSINTLAIAVLVYLHGAQRYSLAYCILNTAFATVAFGPHAGIQAGVLSVALLASIESAAEYDPRVAYGWALVLALLLTLVAIISRVTKLHHDSLFDAVTGLRNHRYFQVRLREELDRTKRYGRPTALVLIDLDDFKHVNDRWGHAVGDQVLRQVAEVLTQCARTADIICRYGGEEVAVILPETGVEDAARAAERLRAAVEAHKDEYGTAVTLSAGVAVCPIHGGDADTLIAAADSAMYRAKAAGKNRVAVVES